MNAIRLFALFFLSSPIASQACGGLGYRWLDVSVNAEGYVSRTVQPEVSPTKEPIRDSYYLRMIGDQVSLKAGLYQGADTNKITVELLEQKSDTFERDGKTQKGVFASLFEVTKTTAPVAGDRPASQIVEYVMIGNNYAGHGNYTRGCGGFQVESDRSKIKMPESRD